MGLGVLTPRGQAAVEQERQGVEIFKASNPDLTYITTPKDRPSRVDGVLVDPQGTIRAVVEAKSRYGITAERFKTSFNNEWLITYEKLLSGSSASSLLQVPLVGFLYLVESKTLLTIQLTDSEGNFCVPFRVQKTTTTKDINGGKTIRNNAFIPMAGAKCYVGRPESKEKQKAYPWGFAEG